VTVTSNPDFRGIRNVHGVASQAKPVLVFTDAPPGVELIVQLSVVPRVIVAHADKPHAIATRSAARMDVPRFARRPAFGAAMREALP